jgi:GT2 family glycosyltransferase
MLRQNTAKEGFSSKGPPFVSIVVLNYNGMEYLQPCFLSILKTDYPTFEVIAVDNGSSDGSAKYLQRVMGPLFIKHGIPFRLIKKTCNLGVGAGRSMGIKHARGEYVAFLDNDMKVDEEWLKNAISLMVDPSIGIVQPKILSIDEPKRIMKTTHRYYWTGLCTEVGAGELDVGQYDHVSEQSFADQVIIARRELFNEIGLLEPWFFLDSEYGDFSLRTWFTGSARVLFVPNSIVYHKGAATRNTYFSSYTKLYSSTRNGIIIMLKNYDLVGLLLYFPISLLIILATRILSRKRGECLYAYAKALLFLIRNLRGILAKRSEVQKLRKVSIRQLIKKGIIKSPDLTMFKKGF